jgi:hypothetical protein
MNCRKSDSNKVSNLGAELEALMKQITSIQFR